MNARLPGNYPVMPLVRVLSIQHECQATWELSCDAPSEGAVYIA